LLFVALVSACAAGLVSGWQAAPRSAALLPSRFPASQLPTALASNQGFGYDQRHRWLRLRLLRTKPLKKHQPTD